MNEAGFLVDTDVATIVAASNAYTARNLVQLYDFVQDNCEGDLSDRLKMSIARAIAEVGQISNLVYKEFPELESTVARRIEILGRAF